MACYAGEKLSLCLELVVVRTANRWSCWTKSLRGQVPTGNYLLLSIRHKKKQIYIFFLSSSLGNNSILAKQQPFLLKFFYNLNCVFNTQIFTPDLGGIQGKMLVHFLFAHSYTALKGSLWQFSEKIGIYCLVL